MRLGRSSPRESTATLPPGLVTRIISCSIWSAFTYWIAVKDMATSKLLSGKGKESPPPSRNSTTPSSPSLLAISAASLRRYLLGSIPTIGFALPV